MKTTFLAVIASGFVFAACGGDDAEEPAATTQAPAATATADAPAAEATEQAATGDAGGEEGVRDMFEDYTEALGDRDWDEACSHLAPETTEKLQANIKQLGVADAPTDCAGLMNTLYDTIDKDPNAKKTIDDITASAEVDKVTITGESASVSWSATVNGQKTPVTQSARIIDGEWKLIDVN